MSLHAPAAAAPPVDGTHRHVHEVAVWGSTVVLDVRTPAADAAALPFAVAQVTDLLNRVDAVFSTWRYETPASLLRHGVLAEDAAPPELRSVLDRCRGIRELTAGAFDPWAVPGGVDVSGYVKGWAAGLAAEVLEQRGFHDLSVDAAGEVVCRGEQSPGTPWSVEVAGPRGSTRPAARARVRDACAATSVLDGRGMHVIDPRTGGVARGCDSATVVGPDAGLADALATALLVDGLDGVLWFRRLPGWSAHLVRGDETVSFGPAFA
ncbi:MAG: FAD:protein FMN transferase [Actinobacteria bacterium]|nr:FAD:protein FMN transferase [Actinomycetota bacterium]